MTETPGPSATDEQQRTTTDPPTGDPAARGPQLRSLDDLRRSRTDRKIAGVAGGLGRHLGIDPTILRVVLVVLCFFGGAGLLLYLVGWLLVPEDGRSYAVIAMRPGTRSVLLVTAGVVAVVLLLGNSWTGAGYPWPLVLVGGAVLVYLALRERRTEQPSYGEVPAYAPGDARDGGSADPQAGSVPPWLPPPPPTPTHSPAPPKRGPLLFWPTLALVAVALGALGSYDASGGSVASAAYPALALAIIGLALLVGSVVGRAGGLILLGLVTAATLAATSLVDAYGTHPGGSGERLVERPLTADDVQGRYRIDNGRVLLDLSQVRDPRQLAGRSVEVTAGAGELVVILPAGVASHVDATVTGPGQVDVPGHSGGGLDTEISTTTGAGPGPSPGTFSLSTHLTIGHIDVRTH